MAGWTVELDGVTLTGEEDATHVGAHACLTAPPAGLGMAELRVEDTILAQRDGARRYADWYQPRIVTLQATVCPDVCPDRCGPVRQRVRDIVDAWSRRCNDAQLVVSPPCECRTESQMSLDGTTGTYASTPNSAATSIPSDIDLRFFGAPDAWGGATQALVGKNDVGDTSYVMQLNPAGFVALGLSDDGGAATFVTSGVVTGFADGAAGGVRVTWRQSDGRVQFFVADNPEDPDGTTWTQLGADQTIAIASIFASSTGAEIGSINGGTARLYSGTVTYVEIRDGIDGTVVADPDFRGEEPGTVTFTDGPGNVWTLNGAATIEQDPTAPVDEATAPYIVTGRPRVADITWSTSNFNCADLLLRFDGNPQMTLADCDGVPIDQCVDLTPDTAQNTVCFDPGTAPNGSPGLCFDAGTAPDGRPGICFDGPIIGDPGLGPQPLTVTGTECVCATITLTGPLMSPTVRNLTTGEQIRYSTGGPGGALGPGDTVTIDGCDGTAVDQLGNDVTSRLEGDFPFRFEPGTDTLALTSFGITDTGTAQVCARPAVVAG